MDYFILICLYLGVLIISGIPSIEKYLNPKIVSVCAWVISLLLLRKEVN